MFTSLTAVDTVLRILLLGPLAVLWVLIVVRVIGVRSFSKMTAFDFAVTVATGSLLATAATAEKWGGYWQALGAIAAILGFQALVAVLRRNSSKVRSLLENDPVLLYRNGTYEEKAMASTRTARCDVESKLREANVLKKDAVCAVVLEATGDVSVLHGEELDPIILKNVQRVS